MEITFGRYRIRSFHKSDVEAIVRYGNNRNVSIHLRETFPFPYRRADAQAWLKFVAGQSPETNFALAAQDELIGGIGLRMLGDVDRVSAELGYWLGEPFWQKGIATEAVRSFLPFCFRQFEIARIYAEVFSGNEPSIRVLEKCGFEPEGIMRQAVIKDGELKDKFIFGLRREEFERRHATS